MKWHTKLGLALFGVGLSLFLVGLCNWPLIFWWLWDGS